MYQVVLMLLMFFFGLSAQADCTLAIEIKGAVSASTYDYVERATKTAHSQGCDSVLVRMNTPGGSLQSTRMIVEHILGADIPFLCLITPQGGHAGSAGAIILQACHYSGGLPTTHMGAATPIMGAQEMPEDLRKKMINDTVSWVENLASLRKRNLSFAREIVSEAKSVGVEEAVRLKALEVVSPDEASFLSTARTAMELQGEIHVVEFAPDLRHQILSFVADPEWAYMIFMGSLALLYFEITHPGMIVPGVLGALGLVLSLIAFHKLAVVWGGLLLIVLGLGFLVAEIFVSSFGVLGAGGLIAVFVGSVFLFDAESGYSLPMSLIFSVVSVFAILVLGVAYLAVKTLKTRTPDFESDLLEAPAYVISVDRDGHSGQVRVLGEIWKFVAESSIEEGDQVQVLERTGLTLKVKKKL